MFCCRYLGSGCTYTDLHNMFRIGITTSNNTSFIVPQSCVVLWECLKGAVFPDFTQPHWYQTAEDFQKNAYFPHCLGAIDGEHIRVIKPEHSASLCYNYKAYFSIVLLAVADSNYHFVYIDVGAVGKTADPTILSNSTFHRALVDGTLDIPLPQQVSEETEPLPYVFVADEAFGMSVNLMRPFPGNHLTREQRIFNYRLTVARRFVECSFGILSNKWRIFHRPLNLKYDTCVSVIKACCALHNYVRNRDGAACN